VARIGDYWLREFGLELLADPAVIEATAYHELTDRFTIAPHHHNASLQFDVITGCTGRVCVEDQWLGFDGELAHVAYPGQVHGYDLVPASPNAAVFNFKLRANLQSVLIADKVLPNVAQLGEPSKTVVASAMGVRQSLGDPSSPRVSAAIHLLQMLVAWPMTKHAGSSGTLDVDEHVEEAASMIESALDEPPTLETLAEAVGVSGRHLTRLFVDATGMTPARYATVRRLDRAKVLLVDRRRPIADIALELGFSSPATFTRWFRSNEGRTPSAFREEPTVF